MFVKYERERNALAFEHWKNVNVFWVGSRKRPLGKCSRNFQIWNPPLTDISVINTLKSLDLFVSLSTTQFLFEYIVITSLTVP